MLVSLAGSLVKLRQIPRMSMRKSQSHPGHYIRAWRQKAGLSQERVAEFLDLTHGAISQLERGITGYTQNTLERLSELFVCSPAELLIGPPESIDQLRKLRQAEEAWVLFERLSEPRKSRIVAQIEDAARLEEKTEPAPALQGTDVRTPAGTDRQDA